MQNNIPSNLQANIEQFRPASDKCNTEYICNDLQLSNKDSYIWYTMTTVLSANFAQVSATQTEC